MRRVNQPDLGGSGGSGGSQIRLYRAAAVRDGAGLRAEPGAVAARGGRVVAAGSPEEVRAEAEKVAGSVAGGELNEIELPGCLLLPGLVNAHAHLDLTELGYRPYGGRFIEWVKMVMAERPGDATAVRRAVLEGAKWSRETGVLTVGDISPKPTAIRALREAGLRGVGYAELFGIGTTEAEARERLAELGFRSDSDGGEDDPGDATVAGLSAHAPYSAGPGLYGALARSNAGAGRVPICTHLAETEAELEFVAEASGPFRELLREMGKWDERYAGDFYGRGEHPADWLSRVTDEGVGRADTEHAAQRPSPWEGEGWVRVGRPESSAAPPPHPASPPKGERGSADRGSASPARDHGSVSPSGTAHWLCAHCNYVEDQHIRALARRGWSVVYCPRASYYFGHRGHRYREMLEAGVNVCLGTDSIVCHGTLSILDEMRHLHRRDGTDPELLLAMATWRGMRALGFEERNGTLGRDAAPGLIALDLRDRGKPDASDPLAAAFAAEEPPAVHVLEEPR